MTTRSVPAKAATTTLAALLLLGSATVVSAQVATPMRDSSHKAQPGMNHAGGMAKTGGMDAGPHHALAMAYRDNLALFARAVHSDVDRSNAVTLDLARPAVVEMRRSFEALQLHHKARPASTPATTPMGTPPSMNMMEDMDKHLASLSEHITALEMTLKADAPDAATVREHTAEILKECEGIMKMPAGMKKK